METPWNAKGPRDLQLPKVNSEYQFAVIDAVAFPSDPVDVTLEQNDVAFKLRSDSQQILQSSSRVNRSRCSAENNAFDAIKP